MAVTSTSLGSNSVNIAYTAGETAANILIAINTFLVAHGWTLFDGATGITDSNVYRAINVDAVMYKYVLVHLTGNKVYLKTYESWDSVLNTGTNLAYFSDSSIWAQQYDLVAGGSLFISSSVRYIAMQSIVLGTGAIGDGFGSGAIAVCEITREHILDTGAAGYPAHLWLNTASMQISQGATFGPISMPRTRDGSIGIAASRDMIISASVGIGGRVYDGSYFSLINSVMGNANAFDGKPLATRILVSKIYGAVGWETKGYIYGLIPIGHTIGGTAPGVDAVWLDLDGAGLLKYTGGSSTKHWVISAGSQIRGAVLS